MKEKGLTKEQVLKLQKKYGKNEILKEKEKSFIVKIFGIICEPMFLLLIVSSTIYFILNQPKDGIIMLVFVIGMISIDIIQEWKTDKTIKALKNLSEPSITVLRDNIKQEIPSSQLVPGDIIYIHEGIKIPADGYVIKCSGLKVDESTLTGESIGVWKTEEDEETKDYWKKNYCYQGTLVIQGTGIIKVDKIGSQTEYGKIGTDINNAEELKTPLENQIDKLVKVCVIIAVILFLLVLIFTFINLSNLDLKSRIIQSILSGITLAMAMIPEEFPVVLTVFLSMGAWRLARKKSLVKKLKSVETLGSITVLCVDKTGTITKNEMEVVECKTSLNIKEFSKILCLACEEQTYDPMELAMFEYAKQFKIYKKDIFNGKKLKEYPFSNDTKMMGYVWKKDDDIILVSKGSPESIIKNCNLSENKINTLFTEIENMQSKGLRVISVAVKKLKTPEEIPDKLENSNLEFVGNIGLVDPPRDKIKEDIEKCKKAGIKVVMITGDNGITAKQIATQIGMDNVDNIITGEMLNELSFNELKNKIKDVSIFSRVIPEHKMDIVKAFQANGEVVAMTGDGVNDAPALKQASIGIAMGKRGSQVSKEASDLILMDDDFSTIVSTISDGRRIYDNIRKAVEYILSIHVPIALTSLIAPLLKIPVSQLMLLPIHIVLLEIIIDPTCSVVLERQPAEANIMNRKPRNKDENIINKKILFKCLMQGLFIFISSFLVYYNLLNIDPILARTMGLLIIIISNMFLVIENFSETENVFKSLKKLLKDKVMIYIFLIIIIGILVILYTPLTSFLKLKPLTLYQLFISIIISFISVFWYEIVKKISS